MNQYTPLLLLLAACCSSAVVAKTPALTKDEVATIRQLAEHGDAGAQSIFGLMYANGVGITENDAEAVKWYRLAAEQGNADAQSNLGVMYFFGSGVSKSAVDAYFWWHLAAARENADAKKFKELIEKTMTREQIAEAQRRSAAWEPKK
jgi:TPR repeat protein